MSTQPIPIAKPRPNSEEAKKRAAAHNRRSNTLYILGAVFIAAGLGWIRLYLAPIALGVFCIALPGLEIVSSFLRGLRR